MKKRYSFYKTRIEDNTAVLLKVLFFVIVLFSVKTIQAQGYWMPLNQWSYDYNEGEMLLLTDGSVLVKSSSGGNDGIGNVWDKLTPDNTGSYINGTWSSVSPMYDTRLYFSSQILKDGRVYVAGGEYGTGYTYGIGGEIYDPATDVWTQTPPVSSSLVIYDANSKMLPDGRILQGVVIDNNASTGTTNLIYDPTTNTYISGPSSFGNHDESAWLKLPDGSILFVDIFSTNAERYIPATNTWVHDAPAPVDLYDPYGGEAGASYMLPDGRGFFIGSTSTTAYYTPSGNSSPGTWAIGPAIPDSLGAPDAASAMLVNGKILMALSHTPTDTANIFTVPTSFYEFDYLTNTFTPVLSPYGHSSDSIATYTTNMLQLPDGTVLYAAFGDDQYYVYVPDGTPLAAGKPTINNVAQILCTSYRVTGTLFNGISEGAAYGDDWQMSTNYPIIQLSDGNGNVYYAKSHDWNRTGVQTGNQPDTVLFDVPVGLLDGTYSLRVIANGISSDPASFTYTSSNTIVASTTPHSRCGTGSVVLNATASSGTLNWYSSPTGGTVLGTGISFNTPVITATTTFYVDATDGCTSVRVPVVATVKTINTSIAITGTTLTAIQDSAGYHWLNCNTQTLISGATHQTYTAPAGSNTAVVITKNGCKDTSECISITNLGIIDYSTESIVMIYPNPTNGIFTVALKENAADKCTLEVDDITGKKIVEKNITKQTPNEIDLTPFPKGVYSVKINDGSKSYVSKIVLQ